MKRSIAIGCMMLAVTLAARGQWMQTAGPAGGIVTAVAADDSAMIAIIHQDVYHNIGNTWQKVGTMKGIGTPGPRPVFENTLLLEDGVLFAATRNGVLRSADYGRSWSPVPVSGAIITDGRDFYAQSNDSLFHSPDDGINWTFQTVLPPFTGKPVFFGGAMLATSGFFSDAVIRSEDGGTSWDTLETNLPASGTTMRILFAGPDALYVVSGGSVFRSTDGRQWTELSSGFEGVFSGAAAGAGGTLWLNTTEGLFQFSNGAWRKADVPRASNFVVTGNGVLVAGADAVYNVDGTTLRGEALGRMPVRQSIGLVAGIGSTVFAGTSTALYRSADRGASWARVAGLQVQVWELVQHENMIFAVTGGLHRSADDGVTWESLTGRMGNEGNDVISLVSTGGTLYAGMGRTFGEHGVTVWNTGGVRRSTDNGQSWTQVNTGFPFRGGVPVPVSDLAVTSSGILASTLEGVYHLPNGGSVWTRSMNGLPANEGNPPRGTFAQLHGALYLITGYEVFQSFDGGASWSAFSTPVPVVDEERWMNSFWSTGEHFYTQVYRWAGGDEFIYRLLRFDGTVWEDITHTQPQGVLLQGFASTGTDLYAGSNSYGVWRMLIPSSVERTTGAGVALAATIHPNPAHEGAIVRFTLPAAATVHITLADMLGRDVMAVDAGSIGAGDHERALDLSGLPAGSYVLRLRGGTYMADMRVMKVR